MNNGQIRLASCSPKVVLGDHEKNAHRIVQSILLAEAHGVEAVVFPPLAITGYTVQDFLLQPNLVQEAKLQLYEIAKQTAFTNVLAVVGLPLLHEGRLFLAAAFVQKGAVLGYQIKTTLTSQNGLLEPRYFANQISKTQTIDGVPIGERLLLQNAQTGATLALVFSDEVLEAIPKSGVLASMGANVLLCQMTAEATTKDEVLAILKSESARTHVALAVAGLGVGESSTDLVFEPTTCLFENGESLPLATANGETVVHYQDVDFGFLPANTNAPKHISDTAHRIVFAYEKRPMPTVRTYAQMPFIPSENKAQALEKMLQLQALGLARRAAHIGASRLVIGVSGGLDSTLALLVCVRAAKLLNKDNNYVLGITMPCFGTSKRTLNNAKLLSYQLSCICEEVQIGEAVRIHLADIGHDGQTEDAAYENAQARERTQVLMDKANMVGGLVVGTGDLSELALGWCTYGGDQMSMYGVNASVPKTLVKALVRHEASRLGGEAKAVLEDILDTPISPELKPEKEGQVQSTEASIGDYLLTDYYLYHLLVRRASIPQTFLAACKSFDGVYTQVQLKKQLKTVVSRMVSQQFKRSCMPDGAKVTCLSLSPRLGLMLPSDATAALWLNAIDKL